MSITRDYFNNRDIALQARDEHGKLAGFIWCGPLANGTIGFIDFLCVHPDFEDKGVAKMLFYNLFQVGKKRGLKSLFGAIRIDKFIDKGFSIQKHWGSDCEDGVFKIVFGHIDEAIKRYNAVKGALHG